MSQVVFSSTISAPKIPEIFQWNEAENPNSAKISKIGVLHILSFLDEKDKKNCSLGCKQLCTLVKSDELWDYKINEDFPELVEHVIKSESAYDNYVRLEKISKKHTVFESIKSNNSTLINECSINWSDYSASISTINSRENWTLSIHNLNDNGKTVATCELPSLMQPENSRTDAYGNHWYKKTEIDPGEYWGISGTGVAQDKDFIFVSQTKYACKDVYCHDRRGGLKRLFIGLVKPILTEDRMIEWRYSYSGGYFKVYDLNGRKLAHNVIEDGTRWSLSVQNDQIIIEAYVRSPGVPAYIYSKDGILISKQN